MKLVMASDSESDIAASLEDLMGRIGVDGN